MDIPTTSIDVDPETLVDAPPEGTTITTPLVLEMADGSTWAASADMLYDSTDGHKTLAGGQLFTDTPNSALSALTYYVVYSGTVPTQMGQNMAACYWNIAESPTDSGRLVAYVNGAETAADANISWAKGERVVLAWTFSVTSARLFVNGVLDRDAACSPYMGATTPTVIPQGEVFRAFIVPSIQTNGQIQALVAELQEEYVLSSATVTWDAPEHTGGAPVTGYLVKVSDAGGHITEHTYDADDDRTLALSYIPPATVQIMAKNSQGMSAPAEVQI